MYKPEYVKIFDDEANTLIRCPVLGGSRYNQWAHKNKYTWAISCIIFYWNWPVIFPLVDRGIIKSHEDESLEWTLKNLDSLAQLFHDWPIDNDPDMPEKYKHIRGGFWAPVETAFNIKRGSLRYLVSTSGRYYDRVNPEYIKVIEALRAELGQEELERWNPKLRQNRQNGIIVHYSKSNTITRGG
jgi:hypothetical protein